MQKPPRLLVAAILAALVLLPARPSFAWIDAGHKIVAMIAWDELTPATQLAVLQTLKAHPRYEKDLVNESPATQPLSEAIIEPLPGAADRHIFATAATWPDIVRLQGHPMHAAYHHALWHYIDIPIVVGNQPIPVDKAENSPPPH